MNAHTARSSRSFRSHLSRSLRSAALILPALLALALAVPHQARADAEVDALAARVREIAATAGTHNSYSGYWAVFDAAACMQDPNTITCSGTNPDSQYLSPYVASASLPTPRPIWKLREDEGVIFILRTPPRMRYFGFTPYLMSRYIDGIPRALFASLDDPLNLQTIVTAKGTAPDWAFDAITAVVVTADQRLYAAAATVLASAGIPKTAINRLALPLTLPLYMGYLPRADAFQVLFRVAVAEDDGALAAYLADPPMTAITFSPKLRRKAIPFPYDGLTPPGSDDPEPLELADRLDALVGLVTARIGNQATLVEHEVIDGKLYGPECIELGRFCGGDTHDGTYSVSLRDHRPASDRDFLLVVGVDHHRQGKAAYIAHAITESRKSVGVTSVNDGDLAGSAAY